jgi:hypothetical protein
MAGALPARAADPDINLDPAITQQEFRTFSRIVGQGIFATPVQPARAGGIVSFDIGVAATLVKVDTRSSYWQHAVSSDFTHNGYVAVPRLVVSKGFSAGTISGTYAKISDTGATIWGGAIDIPIIRGTLASPELAVRGSYSTLSGIDVFKEKTYGLEAFLSKGFGPLMPYAAYGRMKTEATGTIRVGTLSTTLKDTSNMNRLTVGLRVSLFFPKIVIEATNAEVRSYAAKVSFGF